MTQTPVHSGESHPADGNPRNNQIAADTPVYNRRAQDPSINQQGFITMIVFLFILILAAIILVFMRVADAG